MSNWEGVVNDKPHFVMQEYNSMEDFQNGANALALEGYRVNNFSAMGDQLDLHAPQFPKYTQIRIFVVYELPADKNPRRLLVETQNKWANKD